MKVLGRVFRGKFIAGLRTAFREGKLKFHGHLAPLAEPSRFAAWLRLLFCHDWVVYSSGPSADPSSETDFGAEKVASHPARCSTGLTVFPASVVYS